jgi:hypothetical protein
MDRQVCRVEHKLNPQIRFRGAERQIEDQELIENADRQL